jgi:hypothetical protein
MNIRRGERFGAISKLGPEVATALVDAKTWIDAGIALLMGGVLFFLVTTKLGAWSQALATLFLALSVTGAAFEVVGAVLMIRDELRRRRG